MCSCSGLSTVCYVHVIAFSAEYRAMCVQYIQYMAAPGSVGTHLSPDVNYVGLLQVWTL